MRKSSQQRISDTQRAIAQWDSAGLGSDRRLSFMRDSLRTLLLGKSLSTKQREWLDALCAEGPPAPKGDPALRARIDAAMAHLDARGKEALGGFRSTIVRGYKLSEKQEAFMSRLLEGAERIAREGHWQPSREFRAKADFAWSILTSRSSMWQGTHPGTMKACERYDAWRREPSTHHIDEWVVTKMLEACAPAMRELEKPKFEEGEMVEVIPGTLHGAALAASKKGVNWGVVCSAPVALQGKVAYEVLLDGAPVAVFTDHLKRVK